MKWHPYPVNVMVTDLLDFLEPETDVLSVPGLLLLRSWCLNVVALAFCELSQGVASGMEPHEHTHITLTRTRGSILEVSNSMETNSKSLSCTVLAHSLRRHRFQGALGLTAS